MADREIKRNDISSKASVKQAQNRVTPELKSNKAGPEWAWYVSSKEEVACFDVKISGEACKGVWDGKREHVTWRVPSNLSAKFELHHHFVMGKIIKADDNGA